MKLSHFKFELPEGLLAEYPSDGQTRPGHPGLPCASRYPAPGSPTSGRP